MHGWQRRWMMSCFRRVIILIYPSLFLMSSFGRVSSMSDRRRWLSPAGRIWPLTGGRFPVRWRRPAITGLIESVAVLTVCRDFMHALVFILRVEHTLNTTVRSILSLATCGSLCCSFSGNDRRHWRRRTSSDAYRLRWRSGVIVVRMRVDWPWRRYSVLCDWSDLGQGAVPTSVGGHRAGATMTSALWRTYVVARGTIIWISDTVWGRRLGGRGCQWLW